MRNIDWHSLRTRKMREWRCLTLRRKRWPLFTRLAQNRTCLPLIEAFDRLYVSAESGVISIFDQRGKNLEKIGEGFFAANAHTVAVDQRTHRVYFPLQNVGGKPVLRIAVPSDKQL